MMPLEAAAMLIVGVLVAVLISGRLVSRSVISRGKKKPGIW